MAASTALPSSLRRPLFVVALGAVVSGCEKKAPPAAPAPVVDVLEVQPQTVPVTRNWVATVTGYISADIRAQVSGYLQSQNYQNGAYVKAGDVLFQIDPRPFQAALEQAQGSLAQAQAKLTADELNYKRSADLYEKKVISQQQFDDQTQAYQASVAAAQAAQANVNAAQLNLAFTRITAPVSGLASIATAQVGDLVSPSSGTLATVIQVDPIKVQFMIAEQEYVRFIAQFFDDPTKSPIGTNKGPNLPLTLTLADGTKFPEAGRVTSINNVVGIDTGSISVQGEFPNPGNLLRPGQFGIVTAVVREEKDAMVVPQRAVIDLQGLDFLAVVGPDNRVQMRRVTLGFTAGSDQVVSEGLKAGDRVIVEGTQKARDGELVNPQPYVMTPQEQASDPEAAASPSPTASPAPAASPAKN